jgi:hypothetical protein
MKSFKDRLNESTGLATMSIINQVGGDPFVSPNNTPRIPESVDDDTLTFPQFARRDERFHQDQQRMVTHGVPGRGLQAANAAIKLWKAHP